MQRLVAGLAVVAALVTGCGGPPGETTANQASPSPAEEPSVTGEGRLVASQATLPREVADEFADIATAAADAREVWQRFQLTGPPPQVDFNTSALLVVGFGESGSCPARFDGLAVDADVVHVAIGADGGPDCTDDYNARTMVIEVARAVLPNGGFELTVSGRTFVLSSVPLTEPPSHDGAVVAELTAETAQLDFEARPRSVPVGGGVELVLANEGDVAASTGGWPMTLYWWDRQRWLPVDGDQDWDEPSSGIEEHVVTVEPGRQQVVAQIDTETLDPGWYGVHAKLQLGGRGGAVEIHDSFEVGAQ